MLDVAIEAVGLLGQEDAINPPLDLVIRARTRLVRTPDKVVLHESPLVRRSLSPRRPGEWEDGRHLRQDIQRGARAVTDEILDSVLELFPPLPDAPPADQPAVGDWLKFLRDGSTTRREILDRLGEPGRRYERGRVLTYLVWEGHGQMRLSPSSGRDAARYQLVLVFGSDDRVEQHRLLRRPER